MPTIPPNKKVSKVELLQHVIDYILDLQLALETHPALLITSYLVRTTHVLKWDPLGALQ